MNSLIEEKGKRLADNLMKEKKVNRAPLKIKKITVPFDRVIISEDIPESKNEITEGGIILPAAVNMEDTSDDRIARGIVVKAGDKCEYVKDGDMVIFDKFQTNIVKIKGYDYLALRESYIIVIEK